MLSSFQHVQEPIEPYTTHHSFDLLSLCNQFLQPQRWAQSSKSFARNQFHTMFVYTFFFFCFCLIQSWRRTSQKVRVSARNERRGERGTMVEWEKWFSNEGGGGLSVVLLVLTHKVCKKSHTQTYKKKRGRRELVFVSASEKEKIDLNFALPTTTIPENIFVKKKKNVFSTTK